MVSDAATQAADDADIAEAEILMQSALAKSIYDADYDPFAEDDDCDSPIVVEPAALTDLISDEPTENPITRFPSYRWSVHQDVPDVTLSLSFLRSDMVHGYGNITIPSLRSPDSCKDGITIQRVYKKFLFPYPRRGSMIQWLG